MRSKDHEAEAIARALASLEERFGIDPGYFRSYHLFTRRNDVWCCSKEAGEAEFPQIVRRGLRIARVFEHSVKPTTNAVQLFGHLVKRNRVDLDERETKRFLAGQTQDIHLPEGEGCECVTGGVTGTGVISFEKGRKPQVVMRMPRRGTGGVTGTGVTDGFVVAFNKGFALGIGLLKGNKLKSQVPRSRRIIG
ncbi:hypothetical protein CEE36_03765 [candidate division TA06 bacterium B3_TA06]|uniref:Uncharacterized protein n=1 Tax=candidate division TA06 bacterium B3_TA06 TaxID=2012487 RepID=A0A532V8C3_UNCT6|nr:MAG: hypothetical protein CEE36_03765 [candidate division TA06 bacterium B3_TA06]